MANRINFTYHAILCQALDMYNLVMGMEKRRKIGLLKSFKCAFEGMMLGMKGRNAIIHMLFFIMVLFLGSVFSIFAYEWLIILVVSALVMSLELMNTAVEEVCNKLRDDLGLSYEATKNARDIAAGSVLVSAIIAASCGLIIFLPKLILFLYSFIVEL